MIWPIRLRAKQVKPIVHALINYEESMGTVRRISVTAALGLVLITALSAQAADNGDVDVDAHNKGETVKVTESSELKMPFKYENGVLTTMLADFAKASGRKVARQVCSRPTFPAANASTDSSGSKPRW